MSSVPSPIQQGPAPANTQTRIHNNTLKIASVGGGQNAVYHVVGGPISSNVDLSLPAVSSNDTIATLGANNSWSGQHSFAAGLNASGPINSTAPITTSSSITGTSLFSQGGITSNGTIIAGGDITTTGNLVAGGNLNITGTFNPANLSTPGTLTVGTNATVAGTHSVTGNVNLGTGGGATVTLTGIVAGTGMIWKGAGTDSSIFTVTTGTSFGTTIGGSTTQGLGVHGNVTTQNVGGAHSAGTTWTSTEQNMLNAVYTGVRNFGIIN
jgi:filamentous hemagglutinin